MSRLAAIALACRDRLPSIPVLFALEGAGHQLLDAMGLPYVSIPTRKHFSDWSGWATNQRFHIKQRVTEGLLEGANPGLVVFDGVPSKVLARTCLQQQRSIVVCLREVKDLSGYIRSAAGLIEASRMIIVPSLLEDWPLPSTLLSNVRYVGPITRPLPSLSQGSGPRSSVIITGGGGGFPETVEFYNLALEALSICHANGQRLDSTLITGPLFRDWALLKPISGTRILPFAFDILSLFASAALVITQAGYNTLTELGTLRTPTICMPAPRIHDDQYKRATLAAQQRPYFRVLHQAEPFQLSAAILEMLATILVNEPVAPTGAPLGAVRAADAFAELLAES